MKLNERAIHDLAMQYAKLQAEKNLKEQPELIFNHEDLLNNMTASYVYAADYLSSLSDEYIRALIGK